MMEEKDSESKQHELLCVGLGIAVLFPQDKNCKNNQVFLDPKAYNSFFTLLFLLYFNFQFKEFNDRRNHLA